MTAAIFPSDGRDTKRGDGMEAKEKDKAIGRVYDILKNHDQELAVIDATIQTEREALEADLDRIRARATPRAVRYDTPRVQSSPDPDGGLVKIMEAIDRRTDAANRRIAALEERRRQIERVYETVLAMDAKARVVLLTLYYPRRTYEQAAEALGVDVSTISRQRKNAVERLARRVARLEGESLK